jgi:hypothetical protein
MVDYWDAVHILSHSTIIPRDVCNSLLTLMDGVPGSFPFKRSLLYIRDGVQPPVSGRNTVPWVKRNGDGTYSVRPFNVTKELFLQSISILSDKHTAVILASAPWSSTGIVKIKCEAHGEKLVIPRNYVNGKACCMI